MMPVSFPCAMMSVAWAGPYATPCAAFTIDSVTVASWVVGLGWALSSAPFQAP